MNTEINLRKGYGLCPVCSGSLRAKPKYETPAGWSMFPGYDIKTNTLPCYNCRNPYEPIGQVPLRNDGIPCTHDITETKAGRCYYIYRCKHCTFGYSIDSGD